MAETKDVVDRADQLMRRRRTFIAVRPEPEPEIPLPPENNSTTLCEDEDIPTLTEEVIVEALPPEPVLDVAACEPFDESRMLLLAADMSQSISEQITRDLPELLDRVLLDAGADPNLADSNSDAPLHVAARINAGAAILALLQRGASALARNSLGATFQTYYFGYPRTALNLRALAERRDVVAWLTANSVPLEANVESGY